MQDSNAGNQESPIDISRLPSIVVNSNWSMPPSRMPHYMVHSIGDQIEEVASLFISKIKADNMPDVAISVAGEVRNIPNENRPIRIIHKFQRGHKSTTDVVIKREGKNLFIKYSSKPRTMLAYLKFLWRSGMFALLFCILFSVYLAFTGSKTSWVQDYAAKHAKTWYPNEDKSVFMTRMISEGHYTTDWIGFRSKIKSDKVLSNQLYDYDGGLEYIGVKALFIRATFEIGLRNKFQGKPAIDYASDWGQYLPDELVTQFYSQDVSWDNECPLDNKAVYAEVKYTDNMDFANVRTYLGLIFEKDKQLSQKLLDYYDQCTTYERPWSYSQLFFADPKIALANFGMPASIFATFIGFFVWRAPLSWLRFPCKILRWPTPDDFNNSCQARNAWVERGFSETLFEMGINKTDILELSMGQSQS
jgi:hypothetical protein